MSQTDIKQASHNPRDEAVQVRRWRRHQFSLLGFTAADARLLAESSADLAYARKLVRAGCPTGMARKIIL